MSEGMLGKLSLREKRGPMDTLEDLLAGADGPRVLEELKRFNRKEPCWTEREMKQVVSALLALSKARIRLSGTKITFKAGEKFIKANGEVSFYDFGSNFQSWFWPKEEKALGPTSLRSHKLLRNAKDSEIIRELGGEEKVETTLVELYGMLKRQARGQKGVLFTNGWANIFYIRDVSGILREVCVFWCGVVWCVVANALVVNAWFKGSRVFSRNYAKAA